MRLVATITMASMIGTAAWASDLTIQTVGNLYTGQPAGFEVTGLAQGEKLRLSIVEDGGGVVVFGKAMGDATGAAIFTGLLTNNAVSVEVQAQSQAGSEGTATFSIVAVPDGEYYCDADSTDWDEVAGACVSSVEESMNCFQSGYCQGAHDNWGTGAPNSIVGNATEAECQATPNLHDALAWDAGYEAALCTVGSSIWDAFVECV